MPPVMASLKPGAAKSGGIIESAHSSRASKIGPDRRFRPEISDEERARLKEMLGHPISASDDWPALSIASVALVDEFNGAQVRKI